MTTYRKTPLLRERLDTVSVSDVQYDVLWSRLNCLIGFTVVSMLIGAGALAISTMLLLQSFELVSQEQANSEELHHRIGYLEHLVEVLELDKKLTLAGGPVPPFTRTDEGRGEKGREGGAEKTEEGSEQSGGEKVGEGGGEVAVTDHAEVPEEKHIAPTSHRTPPVPRQPSTTTSRLPHFEARTTAPPELMLPKFLVPSVTDDEDDFEGSGNDCVENPPRPVCPMGMRICNAVLGNCPVFVCCK